MASKTRESREALVTLRHPTEDAGVFAASEATYPIIDGVIRVAVAHVAQALQSGFRPEPPTEEPHA